MGMGFGFNDFGFSGFSTGFNIMGIFVTLIFVVVIGMFIVIAVKGISQWNKNNHSPTLTVPATIVAKRTNVSHHHHHNHGGAGMHHTTHSTTYGAFDCCGIPVGEDGLYRNTSCGYTIKEPKVGFLGTDPEVLFLSPSMNAE